MLAHNTSFENTDEAQHLDINTDARHVLNNEFLIAKQKPARVQQQRQQAHKLRTKATESIRMFVQQ